MTRKDIDIYEACDKAIRAMNRENLEAFGRLKMAKWEKINIIRTVLDLYHTAVKKARKRYYGIGFEVYVIGLMMCGIEAKKAHKMADKAITLEWVDRILEQTDYVTLYRFDSETERKAYRLAETLEAFQDRDYEINKALRYWSQQLGQYAINVTDYALLKAFQDAGVEMVEWQTAHDEKVCNECHALDGQVFRIEEVPPKHWNCRCRVIPVFRSEGH